MTVHTTPEIDESAVGRILGIASGTPDPVNTLLRALRQKTNPEKFACTPWGDLSRALYDLYNASDDDEAMAAHDDGCEALNVLLDCDYS